MVVHSNKLRIFSLTQRLMSLDLFLDLVNSSEMSGGLLGLQFHNAAVTDPALHA